MNTENSKETEKVSADKSADEKFEDAVKNFRKEMEKGKGKFSFCGEIERSVSGKQVLVQVCSD